MPRTARLSRDEIVRTARLLASEVGADAVTIRRLAAELGAAPMALYRYFGSRNELITAVVNASGPVDDVAKAMQSTREWKGRLRAALLAVYERAHAESSIVEAAIVNRVSASWELRLLEQVGGILHDAGLPARRAVSLARYGVMVMTSLVVGEIWGRVPPDDGWSAARRQAKELARNLAEAEFPLAKELGSDSLPANRMELVEEAIDFVLLAAEAALEGGVAIRRTEPGRSVPARSSRAQGRG